MSNIDMEFDEKTMIREQERLEREKKRAKRKKTTKTKLLTNQKNTVLNLLDFIKASQFYPQLSLPGYKIPSQ